jgi:c(7)-type cytochrome triheme protein
MPKSLAGNHVDWVKSLDGKAIDPRWDRNDPAANAVVMDLNIVREVKGSMPDVVYPHKQHTEWLDCSNCHPAIFMPQKGANQISMASILLGQKCGVCHGKVAFPVSECRLCHSRKKAEAVVAEKPSRERTALRPPRWRLAAARRAGRAGATTTPRAQLEQRSSWSRGWCRTRRPAQRIATSGNAERSAHIWTRAACTTRWPTDLLAKGDLRRRAQGGRRRAAAPEHGAPLAPDAPARREAAARQRHDQLQASSSG